MQALTHFRMVFIFFCFDSTLSFFGFYINIIINETFSGIENFCKIVHNPIHSGISSGNASSDTFQNSFYFLSQLLCHGGDSAVSHISHLQYKLQASNEII
jgi:hypothetical protein